MTHDANKIARVLTEISTLEEIPISDRTAKDQIRLEILRNKLREGRV